MHLRLLPEKGKYNSRGVKMETQDERTKNLLIEVISPDNVLHIAESLALRAVTSMLKFSEKFYRKYKTDLCRDIAYLYTKRYRGHTA